MSSSFFDLLKMKYSIDLNKQQKQAVLHKNGPAIVLAVPGAGKTTVLISRTANLILNHNINPENILSITFSKAAARDMKDRFSSIFGQGIGSKANFSTIHSFAYSIIRDYACIAKKSYRLIEGESSSTNKTLILREIYRTVNNSFLNEDKLEELLSHISYIKNMMLKIDDFIKANNTSFNNFSEIYNLYESYKKEHNYIDFDDMLTLSYEILKSNSKLLNKYRDKYEYVQVDEGQDTSKIQNEIIKAIVSPKNNLFIVADDDQSIYGFRGAVPEELLDFKSIYPNTKMFYMEENYRSSKNIVYICNEFIKKNTSRYIKNLITSNSNNRPITIVKVKDQYQQYKYIIENISKKQCFYNSAILYRNNISLIGMVEGLIRHNIPFYVRDSKMSFFNHWVLKDIVAFLEVALEPKNSLAFEKIYYKMNRYISKDSISYVLKANMSHSVFDILLEYPGFQYFQLDRIRSLKREFKSLSRKNPYEGISFIEKELEYANYLRDNCKSLGYSYESIKAIISNIKIIAKETKTIQEFLEKLNNMQRAIEDSRYNKGKNAVYLSTIHSAKGLEFEEIYMIDLVDGDFPSQASIEAFEEGNYKLLEEERRLFYVGMTRAKTVLDIITLSTMNNEEVQNSRFVKELEWIMLSLKEIQVKKQLVVGNEISHSKFGKGNIINITNDTITIKFHKEGKKRLSLHSCLEKGLLEIV
ncbi:DNA helicase-2 / ATP-dependent DNA helicase PcrA [Proteiniborus ethanoligenes]|uniref:DNA 3'-5' helicase n=1 Tax=Proteiniborus ethanoligenes TaxID=415015 RepID=A0A1H3PSV4_9FIRM|nr:ATP-dependent helicase [Proteiniborus ethanoligenes]SDZ04187.1 DNA helicase-2 / ATP-dependent DNA helicase PcrA [Proteiniborus ethanoligenes]